MMERAKVIKREFIGRVIGDFEKARLDCISRINKYSEFSNDGFLHSFFGPMTCEQIGVFVHKHMDHHLRQFGA